MKIAIAGSGALGCRIGYMLHRAGEDVTLIDTWPAHVAAIREQGLQVDFNGTADQAQIPVVFPEEYQEQPDLLVVLTKSMQLGAMLASLKQALTPQTQVLCLLNGIGHEEVLAQYVAKDNILIGVTVWTAGLKGPGQALLHGNGHIELQNLVAEDAHKQRAEAVIDTLNRGGLNARYNDQVKQAIWRKACFNGVGNALCTLLDCNLAQLDSTSVLPNLAHQIVTEFSRVAACEGVLLDVTETVALMMATTAKIGAHYPSMHQDLVQNRRLTEVDYINGRVAQLAEQHGVPAPYNACVTQLIHAKEQLLGAQ